MTLRKRLDRLESKTPLPMNLLSSAQRDALDRLAAAIAIGGEAETMARKELGDMLADLHL